MIAIPFRFRLHPRTIPRGDELALRAATLTRRRDTLSRNETMVCDDSSSSASLAIAANALAARGDIEKALRLAGTDFRDLALDYGCSWQVSERRRS